MYNESYHMHDDENDNTIEIIEALAKENGWTYSRRELDYILLTIQLENIDHSYDIGIEWQEDFGALLFTCPLSIKIEGEDMQLNVLKALESVNQNLWMGHFDLSHRQEYPTYRYTALTRMMPGGVSPEMIHDIVDVVINECQRYQPTFESIATGHGDYKRQLEAIVFQTVGEA